MSRSYNRIQKEGRILPEATSKISDDTKALSGRMVRGLREAALIVLGTLAVYLAVALITYTPNDPSWSQSATNTRISNAGGLFGAWFADFFYYLFGYLAYLFPLMVAYSGWLMFVGGRATAPLNIRMGMLRGVGFVLTLCASTALATLHITQVGMLPLNAGGILGAVVGKSLVNVFSFLGSTLFLTAILLTGVTLFTSLSWLRMVDYLGRGLWMMLSWTGSLRLRRNNKEAQNNDDEWEYEYVEEGEYEYEEEAVAPKKERKAKKRKSPTISEKIYENEISDRAAREKQSKLFQSSADEALPSLDLLDPPEPPKNDVNKSVLEEVSRKVESKLKDFGIDVQVVAVHPGPVVTRFELDLAPGTKVNQISNLAKDLARSLSAISVRVVEVIPGKSTVGLELPNENREIVRLSEVLQSKQFDKANSPLTIALGKDIAGHSQVADLAKMPHLLVAGTTGSGKSVGLNAMVLSILYNSTPRQVRMIMIDPKMLELSVYEGIPHLLAPVVTNMKEAANALRWGIMEMDRRYLLMSRLGVRNLAGYNKKVATAIEAGEPIPDPLYKASEDAFADANDPPPTLEELPSIVIVVDELADMMMVVGKKVDELIARLAQKARAAGIHLILATQRPSVDVLTGLIKANIPTRIAFQVSAKVDSRTILDQGGAEQLLGHGDMLYLAPGTGIPQRVHGAFVSDQEVHRVVEDLRQRGAPEYIDEILEGPASGDSGSFMPGMDGEDDIDALYDDAVRWVSEVRKASTSSLQRRFKIGYNRAARMVEKMEADGVVSTPQNNGMREVLVSPPPPDH